MSGNLAPKWNARTLTDKFCLHDVDFQHHVYMTTLTNSQEVVNQVREVVQTVTVELTKAEADLLRLAVIHRSRPSVHRFSAVEQALLRKLTVE